MFACFLGHVPTKAYYNALVVEPIKQIYTSSLVITECSVLVVLTTWGECCLPMPSLMPSPLYLCPSPLASVITFLIVDPGGWGHARQQHTGGRGVHENAGCITPPLSSSGVQGKGSIPLCTWKTGGGDRRGYAQSWGGTAMWEGVSAEGTKGGRWEHTFPHPKGPI